MWYNLVSIDNMVEPEISSKYGPNAYENSSRKSTLARVVLAAILPVMAAIYSGCGDMSINPFQKTPTGQTLESQLGAKEFYKHIKGNILLNKDEKALAIRMYDLYHSEIFKLVSGDDPNLDPAIFDSYLYRKWGLNRREGLSLAEQRYVSGIEDMDDIITTGYKMKRAIDDKTLTKKQKKFLREMHDKYGKGRVSLDKMLGDKDEVLELLSSLFEAMFGHKKLSDQDLLVLDKMFSGLEAIPFALYQ